MLDLTPIKARVAATSPGPWRQDLTTYATVGDVIFTAADGGDESLFTIRDDECPCVLRDEDAEFIAHSKADVVALVAEVMTLRYQLQQQIVNNMLAAMAVDSMMEPNPDDGV